MQSLVASRPELLAPHSPAARQAVENFCKFSCYGRHTYVPGAWVFCPEQTLGQVPEHAVKTANGTAVRTAVNGLDLCPMKEGRASPKVNSSITVVSE